MWGWRYVMRGRVGRGMMMMAGGRANVKDIVRRRALVVVVARHADGALGRAFVGAVVGWMGHETGELVCKVHARSAMACLVAVC